MLTCGAVMHRKTKQRDALVKKFRGAEDPLSVAGCRRGRSVKRPAPGIATVYRALPDLREDSEITVVTLPGEEPRYEPPGLGHHHHFQCLCYGQTFDLEGWPISIAKGTSLLGGYRVEDHDLTLYGRCTVCLA